ncbi:MAG: Mu transposase C-terminal domain-containing protein [Desulfovibrionaceae bacterium]|nr:Mu transposase C-terminal domain-containing protein [Desulfovibrionaceae bacterium]
MHPNIATVRQTYTTKELIEILTLAKSNILLRARRESWRSHPRPGRGGGNEWLLESMPEPTRLAIAAALVAVHAKELDEERRKHSVNTSLAALPQEKREKAEAKAVIAQLARRFLSLSKLQRTAGFELFAIRYNAGEIEAPAWARATIPHVCRASLFNWEKTIAGHGTAALADKHGLHRRGTGAMDQEYVRDFCLAHIYKFPHVEATGIHRDLEARLTLQGRPERLPSPRGLQRWYKAWKAQNKELFTAISNPDQWRSLFRAAFGDAAGLVDRLNQEWEMDSTPADLILADGGRHTIVACIDLFSRRVKFHVSRTSSSHAVATCLRKSVSSWGVPEIVRTDNGRDYVAWHIERVLLDMYILHDVCDPFSPEQKPFVERVFRTFLHDNIELLTGFTGHNVSERKALEARRSFADRMMNRKEQQTVQLNLTADELQQICDRWTDDTYMHRKHRKLGMSPYEKLLSYDGPVRRAENEAALRMLFLPCADGDGTRVVSKDGGVQAFNDKYIAPELALHVGRRVQVRVDDADYGRVHVYNLDGSEFICEARGVRHSGMSGAEVKAVATAAKRLQQQNISGARSALATLANAADLDQIAYERMKADALRARRIEAEQPLRAELMNIHSTGALEGAAEAAKLPDYTPAPVTAEEAAARERALAALEQAKAERTAAVPEETPEQRWGKAENIRERERRGTHVDPEEKRWLTNYETTPEHDSQRLLREFFAPEQLRACG